MLHFCIGSQIGKWLKKKSIQILSTRLKNVPIYCDVYTINTSQISILSKSILIRFNIRCFISLNTLFLFLCLSFPSRFRVPFFSFFGSHNIHNTCSVVLLVKAAFVDRRPFKKVSFTHKDMPSTLYYKTEKRNSIYIVWLCCIVLLGLL